jgi:hypothetical protein
MLMMPRMKKPKQPPFEPYTVCDDDGEEYLIDEPLFPSPKHHKKAKAIRSRMDICNNILDNPDKWDLSTASKFARSADLTEFQSESGDNSALRKGYKKLLGMLSVFKR